MEKKEFNYKEEAIPLVSLDTRTNKFVVNDEAIDFLSSIKGNIGVVAVAGMYRTGKSYLLNRMILGRSNGFGIGPSINPCTKGLWIWGTPVKGQTADGEPLNILVIDSEGIGALDEDSTHDSRIFSLAILLSSCFLYNSVGSIDENAIQNLSLVVNLTKNIHIKSTFGGEEPDSEDYAQYFPSFIWVVRDFTLQLVDSEGDPISAKEYLDKALAAQKGFSDGVEQKNRIRRLLNSFFKERDCHTLVRPLTNEENLQNLEQMELDQLRPEFHQQILALRRQIINRMKFKTLKNKVLNGEMYAGLIRSYTEAINEGAVPNIESAWTYVCKNECMKAVVEATESYDTVIREVLHNKLPLPLEELKNYHMIGKERGFSVFRKRSVGEAAEEYMKELKKKIKLKFCNLRLENEKESNRASSAFIIREFSGIERKLKNNDYKTFQDFEKELKLFHSYFLENGPNGPNKRLIILEFLQKSMNDAAIFFIKNLQQEFELQKTISKDVQKKLEQEINELKSDQSKEKQYLLAKISQLECERSELEIRERNVKEALENIKEERQKFENDIRMEWQAEKEANQRLVEELQNKLVQTEENLKELERRLYLNDSENEKEKALFQQKIQFYEKSLEEISKREKEMATELKNSKKDHLNLMRENSLKYEASNKNLQQKVENLQEKISELENELSSNQQKFEFERKNWQNSDFSFTSSLEEAQNTIRVLQRELNDANENSQRRFETLKDDNERLINEFKEKISLMESGSKQKEEVFKNARHTLEKEKAILSQKIEFLEVQLTEARNQHNEIKKAYEATLQCFEGNNQTHSQGDLKQLEEMKEIHKKEIRKIEGEFENIRKRLQNQIEVLTEKQSELELKSKFAATDTSKEIQNLKEDLEQSEIQRLALLEQNKNLEQQKMKMLKEAEDRFSLRIRQLESQLEDHNAKTEREIKEMQIKSEENLSQLKNFYEIEKERLERRLLDEKDKYEKRIANLSEEYETKLKEEQNLNEEELENLREELREAEIQSNNIAQQYEHELNLKQQTIETLEKYIKEAKENLATIHSSNSASLEQHLSNFSSERTQLIGKIENLTMEIAKKDKEIFALTQAKEQLEVNAMKKEIMLEKAKKELTDEKNGLIEKLEDTRSKLQKVNDEYLEKKVEYGREIALSQQQNEFLNKKIEELQRQVDEIIKRYEEKLKIQKQEFVQEMNEKVDKIMDEKLNLESKYEKSKKSLKEIESTYNKQLSQLEKEKAIVQEKLINLESKKTDSDKKLLADNQAYLAQIYQLKDTFANEKKSLQSEIEKYKAQYIQLDQESGEIMSNYERDKALWKGKFHFLEQQKEQAKLDLVDAQRKFELTLQHLQKHRNADKEENENTQHALVASIEKRYQSQMQEQADNFQQQLLELEEKNKKLEKELKSANDKILVENYGKMGNQSYIEKKISEMIENEKKLQSELENARVERDTKILEYQKLLDSEKESLKNKIADSETKYREAESKRNTLIFEHEKERAKWNLERDHLLNQKNELQDALSKIEKKKETLLRENEKLKSESKVSRRSINLTTGIISNNLLSSKNGNKLRPTSPAHSKTGSINLEKNLADITNYSKPFDTQYSGMSRTGSTSVTSEDEA